MQTYRIDGRASYKTKDYILVQKRSLLILKNKTVYINRIIYRNTQYFLVCDIDFFQLAKYLSAPIPIKTVFSQLGTVHQYLRDDELVT